MSDWHEDLSNKFNIIKKEEKNVYIRVDSRTGNRISNRRISGSIHLSSDNKEINNVTGKGGKGMITLEAVLSDIEKIEKDDNMSEQKKLFAVVKVIMKFLSTMRSNQLLTEDEKVSIRKAKETRVAKETHK